MIKRIQICKQLYQTIQPFFLSADVNGEILFVPCCWKYFCVSAHQVTIKLLLIQNASVWLFCPLCVLSGYLLLLPFEERYFTSTVSLVWNTLLFFWKPFRGRIRLQSCSDSTSLVNFPLWTAYNSTWEVAAFTRALSSPILGGKKSWPSGNEDGLRWFLRDVVSFSTYHQNLFFLSFLSRSTGS